MARRTQLQKTWRDNRRGMTYGRQAHTTTQAPARQSARCEIWLISTHGHYTYSCYAVILPLYAYKGVLRTTTEYTLIYGIIAKNSW